MPALDRIVVVGASLAGLRAVETLRGEGYGGRLTLVGAEPRLPYDRPPLSKELLAGTMTAEETLLRPPDDYATLDVDLRLGTRATGLDLAGRTVVLDGDGERLSFDGLVIATGASPRRLRAPGPGPALDGVHVLRTLDDALAIAAELERGPRVVVVGAGFIGSEVAATCRQRGLDDVTVLETLPVPLARAVGPEMGEMLGNLHRDHGVTVRTNTGVAGFEGGNRVERVVLTDGSTIDADLVVVGVGVAPATGWLEGSGVALDDGVVCDEFCRAAPGVVAAGDVARWRNPLFGVMRVEHWTNATEQGEAAAQTLLGRRTEPFASVPYVWSEQYGLKIEYVGHSRPGDRVTVVDGSVHERRFVAVYERDRRVVAALGIGRPRLLMKYRNQMAEPPP